MPAAHVNKVLNRYVLSVGADVIISHPVKTDSIQLHVKEKAVFCRLWPCCCGILLVS